MMRVNIQRNGLLPKEIYRWPYASFGLMEVGERELREGTGQEIGNLPYLDEQRNKGGEFSKRDP